MRPDGLSGILFWLMTAGTLTAAGPKDAGQKPAAPAGTKPAAVEATPVNRIKAAKGFQVELLYSVPKREQGSWVSMTVDDKGRLIVSDQAGKLYRITPAPLGAKEAATRVEPIEADIGEAQGLLWAFDSLYVMVNKARRHASGLYRVRSSKGDDKLDEVKLLRAIDGAGEHGPHAVVLGPDGKSIYVVVGNHTNAIKYDRSRVPQVWGEDHLLPRMWDAKGHARGILAPGGRFYRTDPEGKNWELICIGFRNCYDMAFNRAGDLFTFDSDMEWDMNTPWYRPTRVCHVVSSGEFGWRSGSGKWPVYYPDSLPPVVDVGPGSPTGMTFGYGAKFPAKYQEALFLCDWSYGKLYALHLEPDGASYKGTFEEFLNGVPLPLTDIVVNPRDGAMYFVIGGRSTQSGLYRVAYAGKESTTPTKPDTRGAEARALRHKLEAFHGHKDPKAVATAWPYLGHADRFIRWAARVAIEHQDPATWREKALTEKDPQTALTALSALARVGDKALQPRFLEALHRLDWTRLNRQQQLELLRIYGLAFIRLGPPDANNAVGIVLRLPPYPTKDRDLNAELCKILVYLEAPGVAGRTLALMAAAPTQEEQIEYAFSLRNLKSGWTMDQRKEYFSWFLKAANYKGGASLSGFIRNIKAEAAANLTPQEKTDLKSILEARPLPAATAKATKPRPHVKNWKVDDLAPLVEKGLTKRDFDRGRSLFAEANCFSCHRFNNEGGAQGPDLSAIAGRFSVRDLLEKVVNPSKAISDQYQAVIITTTDGKLITGRIVNLHNDALHVMTNMLDPDGLAMVDRKKVESMEPSKVSMMPAGLIDTFTQEEVLDLIAYLLSRGERNNKMFH